MTKFYFSQIAFVVFLLHLFSCSSLNRSTEKTAAANQEPIKIVEAKPLKAADLTQVTTSANVKAAHDEVEKQLAKMQAPHQSTEAAQAAKAPVPVEVTGVEPDQAIKWLKNGNKRFLTHHLRSDGQSMKDVKRLSVGQKPHTIVFACSDSRVAPEILFDEKLGELFVIRTAGETLDAMAIASAEYALTHLGVREILVLGHTNCGAVKAACATLEGGDAGSESLNALVKDIHPRIAMFKGKPASVGYVDEVWANTEGVAEDLQRRSKIISSLVKEKKIMISSAIYNLETGKVSFK